MIHQLAPVVLGPVLYLQGKAVRRNTPRLPEPPGDRRGHAGTGRELRLLVLGDSAAAGVGAAHQDEALLGRLVASLSARFTVHWHLCARTGATTTSTLKKARSLTDGPFDVAVTSLGVNDITAGVSRPTWLAQQAELRDVLRTTLGVKALVLSGLPPVHGFPALPQPLRWYLGARASAFDRALEHAVAAEPDVRFLSLRFSSDVNLMATDGFHPGPAAYRAWGERASEVIVKMIGDVSGA